jgi:hypothetical protein
MTRVIRTPATARTVALIIMFATVALAADGPRCGVGDTSAIVVALDQPCWLNRLGAEMPQEMIFALRRDVVPQDCYYGGHDCTAGGRSRPSTPAGSCCGVTSARGRSYCG